MANDIYPVTIPKWGIEMQEGKIVAWHKAEGSQVTQGEDLIDIETDKIVNTVEAPLSGVLRKQIAEEGATLGVGALIGVLAAEGIAEAEIDKFVAGFTPADASPATSSDSVAVQQAAAPPPQTSPSPTPSSRTRVSPAVAQRAKELGIDISKVTGSGRGGRVTQEDLEAYAEQEQPLETEHTDEQPFTSTPLGPVRKVIARRLSESKQTIPHFYLSAEVRMDQALDFRDRQNAARPDQLSVNDIVARAAVLALQDMPALNIHLVGDEIRQFKHVNLAVAVATERGLYTPVIKQAERISLPELSRAIEDLSTRARNSALTPADMLDATFTISNLGMFGVTEFQAIINPPQGAILAVGALRRVLAPDTEPLRSAGMMSVSLSCDHRAIDGALGAQFLARFKQILEQPDKL